MIELKTKIALYKFDLYINHRKNLLCPLDFTYYLSSAGCLYVCIYVIAILATPFNPQLRNFGTTFLMWLSKNVFLHFWKTVRSFQNYCPFYIFILRFLCTLKRNYAKTNGDSNEILFTHKLAGSMHTFAGNIFVQKCPDFCVWLFVFQIVSLVDYSQ